MEQGQAEPPLADAWAGWGNRTLPLDKPLHNIKAQTVRAWDGAALGWVGAGRTRPLRQRACNGEGWLQMLGREPA